MMYSLWKEVSEQIKKKAEDLNNSLQEFNASGSHPSGGSSNEGSARRQERGTTQVPSDTSLKNCLQEKFHIINDKYINGKDFPELQYYNEKLLSGFNSFKRIVGDIYKDRLSSASDGPVSGGDPFRGDNPLHRDAPLRAANAANAASTASAANPHKFGYFDVTSPGEIRKSMHIPSRSVKSPHIARLLEKIKLRKECQTLVGTKKVPLNQVSSSDGRRSRTIGGGSSNRPSAGKGAKGAGRSKPFLNTKAPKGNDSFDLFHHL